MEMQMRLVFLLIVMVSSEAEVLKNLTATERGSVTLPDPVEEHGFLSTGGKIVAMVIEKTFRTFEEVHKDKILWNKNTGLFTITGLQRSDSGIYYIDSKTGRVFINSYRLIVYEPVPTPAVRTLNVSAGSCTLLCSVEKETTLLWYRDEDVVKRSSSALSLPLTVHQQDFSSSYRCVAVNPAEEKTLPVSLVTSCSGLNQKDDNNNSNNSNNKNNRSYWVVGIVIIAFVIFVIVISAVCFFMRKRCAKNKRTTSKTEEERKALSRDDDGKSHNNQTHISGDNNEQGKFPDSSEPAGPADHSSLTTVHDKAEADCITSTDTPDIC